jgi:hypothetical protein
MVVEALMYESTEVLKLETCDEVMARLLRVVMEFTDVVAARLPTKLVVARAVVKYKFVPSSMSEVVVAYQSESARYELSEAKVGRPRDEVAYWSHVFPAPPMRSDEEAMEESPVPPEVGARAVERVSAPVEETDEVAD